MYFLTLYKEEAPISLEEFKSFLEQDSEMEFTNISTFKDQFGNQVKKGGNNLGVWLVAEKTVDQNNVYFKLTDNGKVITGFSEVSLGKLKEIADFLDGYCVIEGDTGEEYGFSKNHPN